MWIFTTIGFFSVVQSHDDDASVVIRARVREDLEALRESYLTDLDIEETPRRDYRFRAVCSKNRWAIAAAALAGDIDYGNFKSAVAARQGIDRAQRYADVWSVMYEMQRAARPPS